MIRTPKRVRAMKDVYGEGDVHRYRASGRSTKIAFETLAEAYAKEGNWVEIYDHHGTFAANRHLMHQIQDMITALGYEHFEFKTNTYRPKIRLKSFRERE